MTRTSGKHLMLRVCTCSDTNCHHTTLSISFLYVWVQADTHSRLILLTVFTPGLSALLQTDALLQDFSKVILLYHFVWTVKGKLLNCHDLSAWQNNGRIHAHECVKAPWTYPESSVRGSAWWTAAWGRSGPFPLHSGTDCCSPPHSRTAFRWRTPRRSPKSYRNTHNVCLFLYPRCVFWSPLRPAAGSPVGLRTLLLLRLLVELGENEAIPALD